MEESLSSLEEGMEGPMEEGMEEGLVSDAELVSLLAELDSSSWPAPPRTPRRRGPRPRLLSPAEKRQKRAEANDRERQRMGKLNSAFDQLRVLLPKHNNDRELSKFETIQIAKNYIRALHQMLAQSEGQS